MWTANSDGSISATQYSNPDCTGQMQISSFSSGICYSGQSAFEFGYDGKPSIPPIFSPTGGGNQPSNVGTASTGSAATFSARCSHTILTISVAFVISCTFLASF